MGHPDLERDSREKNPSGGVGLPAIAWAFLVVLLVCQAAACIAGAAPSLGGKIDFRTFYSSGVILRMGHAFQLYDYDFQHQVQNAVVSQREGALPFLYPPFAALLFVPLSLLSYRHAFLALFSLNLMLLFLTAHVLRPLLPAIRTHNRLLLPALYGGFFCVSVALMQGQISFLLLLLLAGTWVLLRTQRSLLAGLLLSFALMKFQLALPVVALFAFWRQWRVVYGFLWGALGLGLISFALVGWAGLLSYKNSLLGVATQGVSNAVAAKQRYGMFPTDMPNLHGLSYGLSRGAHWGQVLNLVLCCLAIGFAMRQRASLLVAVPAAMLVSYHMQPHDLTLLLLPLTILLDDVLKRRTLLTGNATATSGVLRSRTLAAVLVAAVSFLILPLAALFMAHGMNYLVALAVAIVMAAVAQRAPDPDLTPVSKSAGQRIRPRLPRQ